MLEKIKNDFPIFKKHPNLIYLDNAATTLKPQAMVDAVMDYYTSYSTNVHRGIYDTGEASTQAYEQARATVANFIGAEPKEIVFVKNATEGINLVAAGWAAQHLQAGDNIVLTGYEHHANILPWQRIAGHVGATIYHIPVREDGTLDYTALDTLIDKNTKLVAFSAVSNVTGAYSDNERIIDAAYRVGAPVLFDAAQLVAHERINVKELDVDFLVFSGHKLFGPTGIGVLYISKRMHYSLEPYHVGGGTVFDVNWGLTRYAQAPHMFEAGTPPIAQAIGLAAAIKWFTQLDIKQVQQHETALIGLLLDALEKLPRIRIIGPIEQLKKKGHIVSFVVEGMHAHDVAAYLNEAGIAVRAGHHCAQPLAKQLNIDASVRVSVACYNTVDDIQRLVDCINQLTTL